ncbi:UDP-N-acetylenolpyruvoylglucosamine reductase [Weissella viridescens]|uniref:UDP-N-acetylenolpyruvoylglucosamine reductase n=1 Tax=Weissella viridescens TaxID=1629 RepID=A0A380NWY6_WEIVI|nr:UDP-N-acetylenolpyruvoylglucosamine reductase [Weissella viridescens]
MDFWPRNLDELSEVTRYARNQALPITVLGNASNLIITNQGLRGLVIFLTRLTEVSVNENTVTAAAGAAIIDTAQVACEHDLAGLEWAAGIPGSVGGAVYMNAGAYGGQVDDCLLEAVVLTPEGALKTYSKQALDLVTAIQRSKEPARLLSVQRSSWFPMQR